MSTQRILLQDAEDISEFLFNATGMIPGYTQFSAGAANLEYRCVDLEGVTLLWAKGRAHCRWQDQMTDDGRVHFGFMLSAEKGATSLGQELGPNDAMLFRPGHEMDYVFKGPVETLEIGVSKEIADELGWTFSGAPLAHLPEPIIAQLAQTCREASKLAANKATQTAPHSMPEIRDAVLDALENALFPWLPGNEYAKVKFGENTSAYNTLRSFDSYLSEVGDNVPALNSVSRELGVGRRSLFYALRQSLGITPRRYIEVRRLLELRRRLKLTTPDASTVTELATELGFGDLGRMAGKYHRQFGEYPRDTLKS